MSERTYRPEMPGLFSLQIYFCLRTVSSGGDILCSPEPRCAWRLSMLISQRLMRTRRADGIAGHCRLRNRLLSLSDKTTSHVEPILLHLKLYVVCTDFTRKLYFGIKIMIHTCHMLPSKINIEYSSTMSYNNVIKQFYGRPRAG